MGSSELNMEDFKKIMCNPFYAIQVDPTLCDKHQPMITKDQWVRIQLLALFEDDDGNSFECDPRIKEQAKALFERLLDVLEGNYAR